MAKEKILMVEDDSNVRMAFTHALQSEGYEVTNLASGEEALIFLKKYKYDIVLADYKMKTIDGLEVLKAARENDPEYKVMIITAYWTQNLADKATNSGKDKNSLVLPKKLSVDDLLSHVRNLLDGKKKDNMDKKK